MKIDYLSKGAVRIELAAHEVPTLLTAGQLAEVAGLTVADVERYRAQRAIWSVGRTSSGEHLYFKCALPALTRPVKLIPGRPGLLMELAGQ